MVESSDGTVLLPVGTALRQRWPVPSEVFIYKTRAAYESWTALGLTDENADEMVAVTVEPDCTSFVVSKPDAPSGAIVDEMIEAVMSNRRFALAA